jgi:hypothetical protein
MDLLTTFTHDSKLQAIKAPLPIFKIYKSPQHTLGFSSLLSSPTVSWQRLLNNENFSASHAKVLSLQPSVKNCLGRPKYIQDNSSVRTT